MKKLLLMAAALAALSSQTAMAKTGGIYLKAEGGVNKFMDMKGGAILPTFINDEGKFSGLRTRSLSFKSKYNFLAGVGVGYYFTDEIRADLSVLYSGASYSGTTNGILSAFGYSNLVKYKAKLGLELEVISALINGYVDLWDFGKSKVFVGAGIGVSQMSGKTKTLITVNPGEDNLADTTIEQKLKAKWASTYALHLGGSMEIANGLHLDATYSLRDFGKVKWSEEDVIAKLRSHNLTLGLRVDL